LAGADARCLTTVQTARLGPACRLARHETYVKPGQRAAAASAGPGSLTGREREITALAAQVMSAKAIGEPLHIGERTVESHLARVYLKFSPHSGQQLTDAIATHAR